MPLPQILQDLNEGSNVIDATSLSAFRTALGTGTVAGSTNTVVEKGAVLVKTTITLTATPVTITDDAGVAQYGSAGKIYDFPAGVIFLAGAIVTGNLTLGTTGTIIDTYASAVALGTATATTGATLISTEATWLAQTSNATAVAKVAAVDAVSTGTQITESGARHVDGTATASDVYLNFVVTDDASHTSGTGSFTGTVVLVWINLGDN